MFATPKRHHKSKPFFDHVISFSVAGPPPFLLPSLPFARGAGQPEVLFRSHAALCNLPLPDDRIWLRNYQVLEDPDKKKAGPEGLTLVEVRAAAATIGQEYTMPWIQQSASTLTRTKPSLFPFCLSQVGPRACLNPIKMFAGSFGGPVVYENTAYVSPNAVRANLSAVANCAATPIQSSPLRSCPPSPPPPHTHTRARAHAHPTTTTGTGHAQAAAAGQVREQGGQPRAA